MASTKGPSAYAVELAQKGGTALRKRKQKATVFKSTVGSPYAFEWCVRGRWREAPSSLTL